MSGQQHFVALALAVSLGVLGSASTAWAQYDYDYEGGHVTPCSLDGVNPSYHPEVFANPAVARAYGFAQSRDGTWHTQGCGRDQTVTDESAGQRAPLHPRRTVAAKPSRKVAKSE
jgi:hypothetical protein